MCTQVEDVVAFLSKADIGSVIFSPDEMAIKDAIFSAMSRFGQNAELQCRYSLRIL